MVAQKKKPQSEEKRGLVYYCYAEKRHITPNICLVISSNKRKNRKYCKEKNCKSPSHLCLSCVTYDEIEDDSVVMKLGAVVCKFHALNGYFARKGDYLESSAEYIHECSESIKHCIDLRKKKKNSKSIEYLLDDDAEEEDVEIGDISDEILPPLEEDEITEQELNIVTKK